MYEEPCIWSQKQQLKRLIIKSVNFTVLMIKDLHLTMELKVNA